MYTLKMCIVLSFVIIFHNIASGASFYCVLKEVTFLKQKTNAKKKIGVYFIWQFLKSEKHSFFKRPVFIASLQKSERLRTFVNFY